MPPVGRCLALHTCMCLKALLMQLMVPDVNRSKLDAKRIKYVFFGYCKGIWRHVCWYVWEFKKIIKNSDVVIIEENESIKNDLEMHPSGRNEHHIMVVVDESSKLFFLDLQIGASCRRLCVLMSLLSRPRTVRQLGLPDQAMSLRNIVFPYVFDPRASTAPEIVNCFMVSVCRRSVSSTTTFSWHTGDSKWTSIATGISGSVQFTSSWRK